MRRRVGRLAWRSAVAAAVVVACVGGAWAQGIEIGEVEAAAGQQTRVSATLRTGGGQVAGTQNDLTFATGGNRVVTVVRRPNGRPDCAVNPEINKGSTTFAFQPPGCTADTCTGIRAIVFSSEDVDPIEDGSVLYTCNVQVASDAPGGRYPLTISGTILSNPQGGRVCGPAAGNPPCASDRDGAVVVPGGEPTPTPTVVPSGPGIQISSAQAQRGEVVTISATLSADGNQVAGTQNDLTFATGGNRAVTVVRRPNGRPDCAVNPEINKGSTTFAFQPPGCTAETCTAIRAIVFSSEDVDPIPDGSVLYTCKVQVAADAPDGVYPLTISGTILSNPQGGRVCGPAAGNPPCAGDRSGEVTVGAVGPTPSPTPTTPAEVTPTPTATAVPPTPTGTPTHTATVPVPTATASHTPTVVPGITTLANDISPQVTEIPVINATGFPRQGKVSIGSEHIRYNGTRPSPADPRILLLLNCERGVDGTVAQAHRAGAVVNLIETPVVYDDDGCDCRMTANGNARTAWFVLLPLAALLVLRRRAR